MDISEIRQGIALLPATAQSKPLLDEMLTQIEHLQSNAHAPTLVAVRQELDSRRFPRLGPIGEQTKLSQEHPLGLCQDLSCASCVAQGQELVMAGRGAAQEEIDTALMWAGGAAWQDKIAGAVGKWIAAGRPQPGDRPAFGGDVIE